MQIRHFAKKIGAVKNGGVLKSDTYLYIGIDSFLYVCTTYFTKIS